MNCLKIPMMCDLLHKQWFSWDKQWRKSLHSYLYSPSEFFWRFKLSLWLAKWSDFSPSCWAKCISWSFCSLISLVVFVITLGSVITLDRNFPVEQKTTRRCHLLIFWLSISHQCCPPRECFWSHFIYITYKRFTKIYISEIVSICRLHKPSKYFQQFATKSYKVT